MGDGSAIEWTDATWNPVTGCTKVSPGCDHCYAETIAGRFAGTKAYPAGFDVTLRPDRLEQPLRWRRPRRIFVNSMSDLFHSHVSADYIAQVFAVMAMTQRHTFQVLIKRPGRMCSLLGSWDFRIMVYDHIVAIAGGVEHDEVWPLPNVWLGTSVESQKWADVRIPLLLDTPAAVRFLSCEPLLGKVLLCRCDGAQYEVSRHPFLISPECPLHGTTRLDWVIVGGESGPHARPMHPAWARGLRDQCTVTTIPYFFKQWGEWASCDVETQTAGRALVQLDGHPDAWMVRVGKGAAGRELDGCSWDQFPKVGVPA
jgi:protein gp37